MSDTGNKNLTRKRTIYQQRSFSFGNGIILKISIISRKLYLRKNFFS